MLIFQAFFFDQLLAKSRFFPCFFRAFIATDMDVFGWEQAITSSSTFSKKLKVFSVGQNTSSNTPHVCCSLFWCCQAYNLVQGKQQ